MLSGTAVLTAGWYHVEVGKISSLKVVFDPRPVLAPCLEFCQFLAVVCAHYYRNWPRLHKPRFHFRTSSLEGLLLRGKSSQN